MSLSFGAYKTLFAWILSLWLLHGAWHGDRKNIFFPLSFYSVLKGKVETESLLRF